MSDHFMTSLAAFGVPGGGEILLVLLVILLLFGSKNLPKMARTLGKTLEEFRRAAREVSDEIMHAEDESDRPPKPLPGAVPKEEETPSEVAESNPQEDDKP
jgi:TatA/E family protein of Tat protein translocase